MTNAAAAWLAKRLARKIGPLGTRMPDDAGEQFDGESAEDDRSCARRIADGPAQEQEARRAERREEHQHLDLRVLADDRLHRWERRPPDPRVQCTGDKRERPDKEAPPSHRVVEDVRDDRREWRTSHARMLAVARPTTDHAVDGDEGLRRGRRPLVQPQCPEIAEHGDRDAPDQREPVRCHRSACPAGAPRIVSIIGVNG